MRIEKIDLIKYGHFNNYAIALANSVGLHLIVGPNEAGKTTCLHAVEDLLFGVPERTEMARGDYQNLKIGATLTDSSGQRLELIRRKRRVGSLRTPEDEPLDDLVLQKLLSGVPESLFKSMFGLTHQGLIEGGKELVLGEGEVGESLYGAALGTRGLQALLRRLDDEAQVIWARRATTRKLNEALTRYRSAQDEIKRLRLRPQEWHELEKQVKQTTADREGLRKRLLEAEAILSRLGRIKAALPLMLRRHQLFRQIEELGPGALASPEETERYREVSTGIQTFSLTANQLQEQIDEAQRLLGELKVDENLLAAGPRLDAVVEELGLYRKNATDLNVLKGDRRTLLDKAERVLRRIWPHATIALSQLQLELTATQKDAIRALIGTHAVLVDRSSAAAGRIEELEFEQGELKNRIEQLGEPAVLDLTPGLRAALRAAQLAGDLDSEISELQGQIVRQDRILDHEVQLLQVQSLTPVEAAALCVPSAAQVAAMGVAESRLNVRKEALDEKSEAVGQRKSDFTQQLRELELGGAPPTQDELEATRDERDRLWGVVQISWRGDHGDLPAPYIGDERLADEYKKWVKKADQLADTMRRSSESVLKMAAAQAGLESVASQELTLASARAEIARLSDEHNQAWLTLWPEPITPSDVASMQEFLEQYRTLVARVHEREMARTQLSRRNERRAALETELRRQLLASEYESSSTTFAGLVEEVARICDEADSYRTTHRELSGDLARVSAELKRQRRTVDQAESRAQAMATEVGDRLSASPARSRTQLQLG